MHAINWPVIWEMHQVFFKCGLSSFFLGWWTDVCARRFRTRRVQQFGRPAISKTNVCSLPEPSYRQAQLSWREAFRRSQQGDRNAGRLANKLSPLGYSYHAMRRPCCNWHSRSWRLVAKSCRGLVPAKLWHVWRLWHQVSLLTKAILNSSYRFRLVWHVLLSCSALWRVWSWNAT